MTENYYYVDKTMYLPMLEKSASFLLFTRPRRFGKSLFLSMMRDYYDMNNTGWREEFAGTWIADHPTQWQGKFQVIFYDFSQVNGYAGETLRERFNNYCQDRLDSFLRYYANRYEPEDLERILANPRPASKLADIIDTARRHGYHLYLVIDEYDNFTNVVLSHQGHDSYHALTHADGFYRETFKLYKGSFDRIMMIGISPVTMTDLTSGFNIATNITSNAKYNQMLGFSEQEVLDMIHYYREAGMIDRSDEEIMAEMRPWYDNYCFSIDSYDDNAGMYNANMVLYYLRELMEDGRPPRYMVDKNVSTDFEKLRQIVAFDRNTQGSRQSLIEQIITQGYIDAELKGDFYASQMGEREFLPSLLTYYGMLTIGSGDTGRSNTHLVIPNRNARKQFYDYLSRLYQERLPVAVNHVTTLIEDAAFDGRWHPLFRYLMGEYHTHSNARTQIQGERFVQGYLLGMLSSALCYDVLPECDLYGGYCDFFLQCDYRYRGKIQHTYIIELKYLKADASDADAQRQWDEAVRQAHRYADTPRAVAMREGTTLHTLVLQVRGTQMLRLEEV